MKTIMKKLMTFLLIGLGIIFLTYPIISNWLIERNQTAAIKDYGLTVSEMNDQKKQEELYKAKEYNDLLKGIGIVDPFIPDSGYVLPEEYRSVLNIDGIIGFIEIPKIGVNIPIYHGTDDTVLMKGIGHLQNTAFPIGGLGNHSVLTGHRGLTSAKLFTDLDKLEIGDVFYITVLDEKLTYTIDQILVVEPSDTSELSPIKDMDLATLITCTPYGVNSHRLFVRGERTENIGIEEEVPTLNIITLTYLIPIILILIIILLVNKKKRRKSYEEKKQQRKTE